MQAVLCDICELPIRGHAFEVHYIHGAAVQGETGSARIVHRDGSQMLYLCEPCGQWVQEAMEYLRRGYRDSARFHARYLERSAG